MSFLPTVLAWLAWFGFTVAVIMVDTRIRRGRAQDPDAVDIVSFENTSPWPYVALGVVCGALPLPMYFWSTRKSAIGVLIGLGWVVASFVVTVPIAAGAQWFAARHEISSYAAECESAKGSAVACDLAASAYFRAKNPARAMELLDRSCNLHASADGCLAAAHHLELGDDGVATDAEKARTYETKAQSICAESPTASVMCGALASLAAPAEAGAADAAPAATAPPSAVAEYCHAIVGTDGPTCTERGTSPFDGLAAAFAKRCASEVDAATKNGRIKLDEAAARACVEEHKAARKPKTTKDQHPWRSACDAVVDGLVDKGGACRNSFECKTHLTCVGYTSTTDGTCKDPPKIGEACGAAHSSSLVIKIDMGDHPECGKGARCPFEKCEAKKPKGSDCFEDEQCLEGLSCRVGKCAHAKPNEAGGPRLHSFDCDRGLHCHKEKEGKPGTCIHERAAGATCETDDQCKGRCEKPPGKCRSVCGSG